MRRNGAYDAGFTTENLEASVLFILNFALVNIPILAIFFSLSLVEKPLKLSPVRYCLLSLNLWRNKCRQRKFDKGQLSFSINGRIAARYWHCRHGKTWHQRPGGYQSIGLFCGTARRHQLLPDCPGDLGGLKSGQDFYKNPESRRHQSIDIVGASAKALGELLGQELESMVAAKEETL